MVWNIILCQPSIVNTGILLLWPIVRHEFQTPSPLFDYCSLKPFFGFIRMVDDDCLKTSHL